MVTVITRFIHIATNGSRRIKLSITSTDLIYLRDENYPRNSNTSENLPPLTLPSSHSLSIAFSEQQDTIKFAYDLSESYFFYLRSNCSWQILSSLCAHRLPLTGYKRIYAIHVRQNRIMGCMRSQAHTHTETSKASVYWLQTHSD